MELPPRSTAGWMFKSFTDRLVTEVELAQKQHPSLKLSPTTKGNTKTHTQAQAQASCCSSDTANPHRDTLTHEDCAADSAHAHTHTHSTDVNDWGYSERHVLDEFSVHESSGTSRLSSESTQSSNELLKVVFGCFLRVCVCVYVCACVGVCVLI